MCPPRAEHPAGAFARAAARLPLREAVEKARELLAAAAATGDATFAAEAARVLQAAEGVDEAAPAPASPQGTRLQEALRHAEEELHRRDEFLAVVAHELRNPLAPLVFSADALLTQAESGQVPDAPTLLRHLHLFQRQLDRLKNDLNRLLDFSRVRTGRLDLELETVDLREVVAEVLDEVRNEMAIARCEVRLVAPEPVEGTWDRLRLRQVAWNLLSNAAKFGADAPIDVFVGGDEGSGVLRVRDHGTGVPPHEQWRIFRQWERSSSHQPHTGFGVGLWLVKEIVEALGGTVTLESAPGAGASFMVTLPRRTDG